MPRPGFRAREDANFRSAGRDIRFRAPRLEPLERDGIERHWFLARVKSRVMEGKVRLRLRTARILRGETVHHIENDFLGNDRISINDGDTFRTETGAECES